MTGEGTAQEKRETFRENDLKRIRGDCYKIESENRKAVVAQISRWLERGRRGANHPLKSASKTSQIKILTRMTVSGSIAMIRS